MIGFHQSRCDTSLFIYRQGSDTAYLLLYVDNIVLTASSTGLLQRIISSLHKEFAMTDLGTLNYFLGIHATRNASGMFLSQRQYATEVIERAGMPTCHPCRTPVEPGAKLTSHGPPVKDPTLYRSLAGALQYLTFTRPDITYTVQQICLFMHDPREQHMHALRRIIRYIKGTSDLGLQLYASSPTTLVAYSDADWAGCPTTRRSTSGYCVFLGNNLLSWSSKWQLTPSRSSAEAEYRGVANAVVETCWIRNLPASFIVLSPPLLWYTVITSARSTYLLTQFSISGPSTLRSTFTLFAILLLRGRYGFFTCHPDISLLTSSPKVSRMYCLMSSDPV
ncbi:uncharacterized mitochondrial protein AtMg00810-like [Rutidosis leptorrhynchoides]|uniref:uncharacterized mitochondrial protein AtMg00810-like n=1 Tax=Rutidosis leptorrhynchoides TaxID=125765 RepID=UPI003A98F8C7